MVGAPVFQNLEFGRSPVVGTKREFSGETVMLDKKKLASAEDSGIPWYSGLSAAT
jgi:hypothetical protein